MCETVRSTPHLGWVAQCVCGDWLMAERLEFGYNKPCSHCLPASSDHHRDPPRNHRPSANAVTTSLVSIHRHPPNQSFLPKWPIPIGTFFTPVANSPAMYFLHRIVNLHSVQVLILRNGVGFLCQLVQCMIADRSPRFEYSR